MRTYYLVHGRDGSSNNDWFSWLSEQLTQKGNNVICQTMPTPSAPIIEDWVLALSTQINHLDSSVYFVGHSIGCQTILRYLETINTPIGGCFFVAPWFDLLPECITDAESQNIAFPWIQSHIDCKQIKTICSNVVALFSDNDYCVSLDEKEKFEKLLGAKTYVYTQKGHFTEDDGCRQLPELLDLL